MREVIGIFPEGPKKKPEMIRGKTGAVRIALKSGKPIVPAGIKNTAKVLPMEKWLPRRFSRIIKVNIGKPIYFNRKKAHNKKDLRRMTDELMKEIERLKNEI